MTSEPPVPDGQPDDDAGIFETEETSLNEATELVDFAPVAVSSPQPSAPLPESWFMRVAFPGAEAVLWMVGALGALIMGTIAGGMVSLLISYLNNPEQAFNIADLEKASLEMVVGSQIFLLFFGLLGGFLRYGPRFLSRFGLRKISPAHFLAIVGLTLPLQFLAQFFAVIANEVLMELGVPDTTELYTKQMEELLSSGPFALILILIAISPAICEELIFRGLIGTTLVRRWGAVPGVLMASLLFGVMHMIPIQVVAVIPMGIAMHYVYLMTKSFWAPMLLHFCNNALALGFSKLAEGLAEVDAEPVEAMEVLPTNLLLLSAASFVLLLVILWQTRRHFCLPDGEVWNPGYATVEPPPTALRATLQSREATGSTYLLVVLSLVSLAGLIYLTIQA